MTSRLDLKTSCLTLLMWILGGCIDLHEGYLHEVGINSDEIGNLKSAPEIRAIHFFPNSLKFITLPHTNTLVDVVRSMQCTVALTPIAVTSRISSILRILLLLFRTVFYRGFEPPWSLIMFARFPMHSLAQKITHIGYRNHSTKD
jgi:hypothetical protein